MPPRKKTKKTYRRDNAVSLIGLVSAGVQADAVTRAVADVGLWEFFTSKTNPGTWEWTLPELIGQASNQGGAFGSVGSMGANSLPDIITRNIRTNGWGALTTVIGVNVVERVVRRVGRKPIRAGNKFLKMTGLRSMVKV